MKQRFEPPDVGRLAFPDDKHIPTFLSQPRLDTRVARNVAVELALPVFWPRPGRSGPPAARVPVPPAAMNEHDLPLARERQVGRSGQISAMKSEAVSESVSRFADEEFGLRVGSTDSAHQSRALGRGQMVDHTPT